MLFYSVGGFVFYSLFLKSKYIPKAISLWGMIAVILGLGGIVAGFFDMSVPLYVFLPILPFELTIGLWLMIKGVKRAALE